MRLHRGNIRRSLSKMRILCGLPVRLFATRWTRSDATGTWFLEAENHQAMTGSISRTLFWATGLRKPRYCTGTRSSLTRVNTITG
jgi:hypothetical protein